MSNISNIIINLMLNQKKSLIIYALIILCIVFMLLFASCSNNSNDGNDDINNNINNLSGNKGYKASGNEDYESKEVSNSNYFAVDIYDQDKAYNGTTLFPFGYDSNNPAIIEVDMNGNIVWKFALPEHLKKYINPGFDVELLDNNHILFVLPGSGVYEIDRAGNFVWEYNDPQVSHDADRLDNGNTLVVFGNNDKKIDAQVKEVDTNGDIVWEWHAADYFDYSPYDEIFEQGWTHTNAVSRMRNGHTLISPRNFGFLVVVDENGDVVDTIGEGLMVHQHDPVILDTGNILFANHGIPQYAYEIDPVTDEILWQFVIEERNNWPVRDANRLPNGNTLITGTSKILEVTKEGEVVWTLEIANPDPNSELIQTKGFYKAERI